MNTQAKLLAAYALATQKQFEQASAVLGPLLPTAQPVERDLRARILFALGDEAGAEALWNDLLVADPSNRRAQAAIGYLRRVQRRRRLFRPVKTPHSGFNVKQQFSANFFGDTSDRLAFFSGRMSRRPSARNTSLFGEPSSPRCVNELGGSCATLGSG
ncbi:MAG: tetratricopeptide repeat protein [Lentisphaerae bacterium]|nr:tetratricopeptide repeat protein [Lentisphaerota bacterium]